MLELRNAAALLDFAVTEKLPDEIEGMQSIDCGGLGVERVKKKKSSCGLAHARLV